MLTVDDTDGDGLIDILTYAALDESGRTVLDVVDYEVDGQLDMRLSHRAGSLEIRHVDRWYAVETPRWPPWNRRRRKVRRARAGGHPIGCSLRDDA